MVDAGSGLLDETTPWLPQRPSWLRDEPGIRQAIDGRCRRRHVLGRQAARGPAGRGHRGPRRPARDDRAPSRSPARPEPTSSRWPRCSRSPSRTSRATPPRSRSGGWPRSPTRRCGPARTRSPTCSTAPRSSTPKRWRGAARCPGSASRRSAWRSNRPTPTGWPPPCATDDVVARVADGAVVCDLRTVDPGRRPRVARRVAGGRARHRRVRVVATAGHVDHGKSSLVLALTGTDPDRFAEEKARGLTIDLGFAFTTLPSGTEVGFVDVPGHERFVKNMLAGVGAVDVALFVVAAGEGWMPQSEEHLRILDLLDVHHGLVAITKADTVTPDLLELTHLDVVEHLATSSLDGAPVVVCDSVSGRGLDDVRATLDDVLAAAGAPADRDRPRLWIDRVFAARGAGTVVTGTLVGGAVAIDDTAPHRATRPFGTGALDRERPPFARTRRARCPGRAQPRRDRPPRPRPRRRARARRRVAGGDARRRAGAADSRRSGAAPRPRLVAAVGSGEHPIRARVLDDTAEARPSSLRRATAPGGRRPHRAARPGPGPHHRGRRGARRGVVVPARHRTLRLGPGTRAAPPGRSRMAEPTGAEPPRRPRSGRGRRDDDRRGRDAARSSASASGWRRPTTSERSATACRRSSLRITTTSRCPPDSSCTRWPRRSATRPDQVRAALVEVGTLTVEQGVVRDPSRTQRASDTDARHVRSSRCSTRLPSRHRRRPTPCSTRALVREGMLVDLDGIVFTTGALTRARAVAAHRARRRWDGQRRRCARAPRELTEVRGPSARAVRP